MQVVQPKPTRLKPSVEVFLKVRRLSDIRSTTCEPGASGFHPGLAGQAKRAPCGRQARAHPSRRVGVLVQDVIGRDHHVAVIAGGPALDTPKPLMAGQVGGRAAGPAIGAHSGDACETLAGVADGLGELRRRGQRDVVLRPFRAGSRGDRPDPVPASRNTPAHNRRRARSRCPWRRPRPARSVLVAAGQAQVAQGRRPSTGKKPQVAPYSGPCWRWWRGRPAAGWSRPSP